GEGLEVAGETFGAVLVLAAALAADLLLVVADQALTLAVGVLLAGRLRLGLGLGLGLDALAVDADLALTLAVLVGLAFRRGLGVLTLALHTDLARLAVGEILLGALGLLATDALALLAGLTLGAGVVALAAVVVVGVQVHAGVTAGGEGRLALLAVLVGVLLVLGAGEGAEGGSQDEGEHVAQLPNVHVASPCSRSVPAVGQRSEGATRPSGVRLVLQEGCRPEHRGCGRLW